MFKKHCDTHASKIYTRCPGNKVCVQNEYLCDSHINCPWPFEPLGTNFKYALCDQAKQLKNTRVTFKTSTNNEQFWNTESNRGSTTTRNGHDWIGFKKDKWKIVLTILLPGTFIAIIGIGNVCSLL